MTTAAREARRAYRKTQDKGDLSGTAHEYLDDTGKIRLWHQTIMERHIDQKLRDGREYERRLRAQATSVGNQPETPCRGEVEPMPEEQDGETVNIDSPQTTTHHHHYPGEQPAPTLPSVQPPSNGNKLFWPAMAAGFVGTVTGVAAIAYVARDGLERPDTQPPVVQPEPDANAEYDIVLE